MKKILDRLRFKYYFYKVRYAKALASLEKYPYSGDELWACYSLGMYKTVANSKWDGRHLRGGFAFCVSLAAMGRFEEAKNTLEKLEKLRRFNKYRFKLASALSPYIPSLALKIADVPPVPSQLYVGLLMQIGEREKAERLLENLQIDGELHLLKSAVFASSPKEQLSALNNFLSYYGLGAISLINEQKSVSVTNIKCTALPSTADNLPLVSVLMTSYNTSSYVKHSIESVLAQSYKNLEIIIVDDNSTDDTSNLIKETAAKDRRVKFFTNKTNLGAFTSKTLALKHAKGEFIVCHDSDDFAHCEWIERQIKPLLENSKFIASVSHWVKIDDNGVFYTRNIYPLLRRHVTSLMFKRAVLDKIGAWDIVRTGADSEFYKRLRIVFGKRSIKDIKLPLVIGAYRENSLTASPHSGYTSPARLAYVESYSRWHIECLKKGKNPIMTTDKRPFSAPKEIITKTPS